MYILYVFLGVISFLQSIIGFTIMSSSVMRFKKPVKKRIIIAFSIMLFVMILYLVALYVFGVQLMERFAILVILIAFLPWNLICSKDGFFASLFNLLTFINIYIAISYFSDKLVIHQSGVLKILEYVLIRGVIWTAIILFLFKFIRKPVFRIMNNLQKEWRAATLVPVIFIVLQIAVLYYPILYWRWEKNNWYSVIIVIIYLLFLAVYYLLYIQANATIEKYMLEKREILTVQQNKLWETELNRQKSELALAKQNRHDMHHHNSALLGMLKSGDLESLEKYIKDYDKSLDTYFGKEFCSHSIINSLLSSYEKRAKDKSITTKFNAMVPQAIGIENIDLVCVLGNALENAFEGCNRIPNDKPKEIIFFAKFFNNRLCIQIQNTCVDNIEFDGELPISQKVDGGTGIKSIVYTAEHYDGTAGFSYEDGKFVTRIVMNSH